MFRHRTTAATLTRLALGLAGLTVLTGPATTVGPVLTIADPGEGSDPGTPMAISPQGGRSPDPKPV